METAALRHAEAMPQFLGFVGAAACRTAWEWNKRVEVDFQQNILLPLVA